MDKILEIKPMGGLANRMRAIASAYNLACDCDRKLKVIWYPLSELNATFSDLFLTDNLPFDLYECNFFDFWFKYSEPRKKNLYISKIYQIFNKDLYLSDCDKSINEFIEKNEEMINIVKLYNNPIISSGLDFYKSSKDVYDKIFTPTPEVQYYIDKYIGLFDKNTIGVHIRRTDNKESIKHSPLNLFVERMKNIIKINPENSYYVASDDETIKKYLCNIFGEKIIMSDFKLVRNKKIAIIQAVAELYLLSKTKMILGSYYSSFSELAAVIGDIKLEQIYL